MSEHVLTILPTHGHGGCEYNALSALKYLRDLHESRVTVSFPLVPETAFLEELCVRNGIDIEPLDCTFDRSDDSQRTARQRKVTIELIERVQPSVALVPLPWPKRGQGVIAGCADCGLPTLVKFALVPETSPDGEFVLPAAREAQHSRQLWFANSRYSAELIERHWKLRPRSVDWFHVGPIGLASLLPSPDDRRTKSQARAEICREFELSQDCRIAVTVARLDEQKGYRTYMAAAARLLEEQPDLVLLWIGQGELMPGLQRWIEAEDLGARVKLAGFRTDVRDFLKAGDLFVLPTLYEGGCSQALLEALDEELPVVVTDTSAIAEMISHGENGLLVPVRDADALGSAISRVLAEPGLADRLKAGARRMAVVYSAERSFEETFARLRAVSARNGLISSSIPAARLRPLSSLSPVSIRAAGPGFGAGWHECERNPDGRGFRWMGHAGTISTEIALDRPATIEMTGYSSRSADALRTLTLHVNDLELPRLRDRDVASDHEWSCTWLIENVPSTERRTILRLASRGAQRPRDISAANQDERWLSVAVQTIRIVAVD